MESIELDPDEIIFDPTDTATEHAPSAAAPTRMPAGTIAPPMAANGELESLRSQARRFRSSEAWDELARTLRRMIDVCELQDLVDEDETIELYAQLGQLEADVLGRTHEAIDAWRKVVAIDPSELRALAALEDLFAREGRWDELVDVLEKRALVLDDDAERRETLLQAAAILEDKVADASRAAAIYERVRRAEPDDELASERLVAVYKQQGKWTELVDMLLEQAESGEVDHQIQILHDVAAIYEHEIGEQESAFYVLQAAFNRDVAHPQTTRELERLATATGLWPELLDEYSKHAGTSADAWATIAGSYIEQLANFDRATDAVQHALRIDPHHAGALATSAELQRKRGNWNALGETLQRQAAIEPSHEKKTQLYLQIAESIERQQQDVAGAIQAYQQALAHDSSSRAALDGLDRLYRRTQAWEQLALVLSHRAALSTDEAEIVRTRLELGSIYDERLADAVQSIAAFEQVLELEPANLVALRALEVLFETAGHADKFLAVLEAQLDASRGDTERVAIYERMAAALEERFGNLDRAAETYEKILAIDPRNNATYHLLERLYHQAGSFEALAETYRNHARATTEVASRIEIYVAMGEVYDTKLHDVDRAIEAYNDALSLDADEAHALEALGRLYEQLGEWDHAIHVMGRLVDVCDDERKHDVYLRLGHIQYGQLGDADGAEASWLRGLAQAPAHVPTMEALTRQYSDRGDWLKAAQMMTRAETHTTLAVDKVRLLFVAANIYFHQLRADEQAKQMYAAVIALDPEHVDAGRPLAELYFAAAQWPELSPVIEMLCRKAGESELYYRAARCADELGDAHRALAHYKAAYDLDPGHLPTLLGRADLLFKQSDWASAGKLYQTAMVDHRDGLGEREIVRVYGRLGMVRSALGDRKKALAMFEKALELDPHDRELLLAVVELQAQLGDWEAVVRAKRALIETSDEREQAKLLDEVAAIYRDRIHHPQKATAVYLEALELAPDDRQLLQKVLDLFIDTKQWRKAVEVMERFVALESDAFHKGVYLHAAAAVCRDELKALDEAVDYYGCALDCFFSEPDRLDDQQLPRALKSFEAIDKVLTTKRDWKAQELAYRDMIKRLPKGGDQRFFKLQVGLIDGLGEIYRSRLKQYKEATAAFEIAQQMDPDNKLRHNGTDRAEILAELYTVAGADDTDKAVVQHARMLLGDPFKYDSYRALARIYKTTQQWDKYWCVCNALKFFKKAEPDELKFYEQYRPRGLVKAKHVMTPESWAKLAHTDENRYISAIFGACWQGVAAMKAFPHKDFGIKREERRQLQGDQLMFSKLFLYLAQVLNVPLPEVYLLDDNKAVDIQLANAIEKSEVCPSFVVRPHALQGKTEREVAFLLARRLAFMRPEYYLRMLLPTNTELKIVLLSTIVMLQPRFPVPPNMVEPVQQYLPKMQKRLPPHALEQLDAVIQRFIKATPEINLAKWGHAVDAVSHRAGFVACGDLEVAARAVAGESVVVDGPTAKDKVKELVLFSVSEEYFAVRAQMGLAIG
ncbi:MAG TPA: tetratricopeptide repeat protein [Kofleriaceae bacterium]|jgi:tetratricopeptide (TPR) repeat protein|nr:tetratricopeptide repeat protein [Kofleriaceae bacterium]